MLIGHARSREQLIYAERRFQHLRRWLLLNTNFLFDSIYHRVLPSLGYFHLNENQLKNDLNLQQSCDNVTGKYCAIGSYFTAPFSFSFTSLTVRLALNWKLATAIGLDIIFKGSNRCCFIRLLSLDMLDPSTIRTSNIKPNKQDKQKTREIEVEIESEPSGVLFGNNNSESSNRFERYSSQPNGCTETV